MAQPKLPAEHLACFEIQHYLAVVPLPVDPQVGEVLYPAARVGHTGIVHASLRPGFITEYRIAPERVFWRCYLWFCAAAVVFLTPTGNGNASECTDAPGFAVAPVKLCRNAPHAVAWVLLMH